MDFNMWVVDVFGALYERLNCKIELSRFSLTIKAPHTKIRWEIPRKELKMFFDRGCNAETTACHIIIYIRDDWAGLLFRKGESDD